MINSLGLSSECLPKKENTRGTDGRKMTTPTFMLVPSLACQASCKYCFGPHKGAVMDEGVAREAIGFIQQIALESAAKELHIIFHGGEPLLAPITVWEVLFAEIKSKLAGFRHNLSMQSNLWNLDDEFIRLFYENKVSIGTSIDGPQALCDINRGEGYFEKTFASIRRANMAGCSVSGIATVTKQTLPHAQEVVKFFRNNGMSMVLHDAVAPLDNPLSPYALNSDEYAEMIMGLFPWYVENCKYIQIDTLDHFVRGVVTGNPHVCTLRDCLGLFLSVSPNGDISTCQRLAGKNEFTLGNIFDKPTLQELYGSAPARRLQSREIQVAERCAQCDWLQVCKGGCYYNALASGDGVIDPHCEAYKKIFAFVQQQIIEEMLSEENMEALTRPPLEPDEHPLLRKGAYISLTGATHPSKKADNARRILALYELSKTNDTYTAAQNLFDQKICGNPEVTEKLLEDIRHSINRSQFRRNNCYAHVTFDCNLRCSHCYANAGKSADEMRPKDFERLIEEALEAEFRQIIITGGEPMTHTQRDELLKICRNNKGRGINLVLRTNLTGAFDDPFFEALAASLDQVVVSVDGNEETHDARRGTGSYRNMVRNLERYVEAASGIPDAAELSLACVMRADDIKGEPGQSVRLLGKHLNVRRVRFRPLLPLGRAKDLDEPVMCEGLMQHVEPEDMLTSECRPLLTCGIGQNIFLHPDGSSYPCYAWCEEHTYIDNVFTRGLSTVLESPMFLRLTECTVDTIDKCRECEFRYLCGGACRAWGNQSAHDLNAMPVTCDHLKDRAQKLVNAAREYVMR